MTPLLHMAVASNLIFWAIVAGFVFVALVMCYVAICLPELPWEREYDDER